MPNLIRVARAGARRVRAGPPFAALALALALAFVAGPLTGPAAAHTELRTSTPAKNAQVDPPSKIDLVFTEKLRADLVQVQVIDGEGRRHESGDPEVSGETVTQRVKGTLSAGRYAAVYFVISADGHPVKGEVPFAVAGGAANGGGATPGKAAGAGANGGQARSAPPGAPAGESADGAAAPPDGLERGASSGAIGWGWVLGGLIAVAGIVAAVVLWRKRASSS